ncbi:MAG TPA: SDR family oxidoreductase [Cyclobacteriaceae bacterium]|nr:SDR family oxidoreductase [Cyclobacteriaceae bacterium]
MLIDLKDKLALVCGSTQGIGKASALQLAESGASVILFARNEEKIKQVVNELSTSRGQSHQYLVADFLDPEKVKEQIHNIIGSGKIIHIVVNNTGGPAPGTAIDADPADFLKGFNAHLISYQHIAQAVVPGMKKAGYGRLINIISTSVKAPIQGLGVSNTIRGAVANWAKTLSVELAPFGITVNNILPGNIDTTRLKSIFEKRSKDAGITLESYTKQALATIPARRLADPKEAGWAVTFLASDKASYINGINLPVDGGFTPGL